MKARIGEHFQCQNFWTRVTQHRLDLFLFSLNITSPKQTAKNIAQACTFNTRSIALGYLGTSAEMNKHGPMMFRAAYPTNSRPLTKVNLMCPARFAAARGQMRIIQRSVVGMIHAQAARFI